MSEVAGLAEEGRGALERRDLAQLASLMRRNFQLRRRIFGDAVVGASNLHMVSVAESAGAAAKLTGSGGAVVALCAGGKEQVRELMAACAAGGLTCEEVRVGPTLHEARDF